MLRLAQPSAGQRVPPAGGSGNGSWRPRGPSWSAGWEARVLLATAGALYFLGAEYAPFDRIDAWIDERFFWEPLGLVLVAVLAVLAVRDRRERRRPNGPSAERSPDGLPRVESVA